MKTLKIFTAAAVILFVASWARDLGKNTETEIAISDLPAAVTDYISQNYSGYSVEEVEKEETSKGTFYEVELEANNVEIELLFDSNGKFIKKEVETEEDEDEEGDEDND